MTLVWSPGYAPVDEHYDNVSLLLYGNGTNGSTTITDNSPSPKTVTAVGNAQISTAQSKFGGASIAFDGAGDYLTIPHSTGLNLATGDFTIEWWLRPNSILVGGIILDFRVGLLGRGLALVQTAATPGAIRFLAGDNNDINGWEVEITSQPLLSTGQWSHVAATRSGTIFQIFIDGILSGSANSAVVIEFPTSGNIEVGIGADLTSIPYNGYIDDLRITKGVARYTSNFIPPTESFPDLSPTGRLAIP
jgi:hypothetical protein